MNDAMDALVARIDNDPLPCDLLLAQLGGSRRLKVLVGLKTLFSKNDGRTLCLGVMKGNYVEITHDAGSDTYSLTASVIRGRNIKSRPTLSLLYAEDPHETLYAETGLCWRLNPR